MYFYQAHFAGIRDKDTGKRYGNGVDNRKKPDAIMDAQEGFDAIKELNGEQTPSEADGVSQRCPHSFDVR